MEDYLLMSTNAKYCILVTCLLVLVSPASKCQSNDTSWQKGTIQLTSGRIVEGQLRFTPEVLEKNEQLEWIQGVHYQDRSYVSYRVVTKGKVVFQDSKSVIVYHANELQQFSVFSDNGDTLYYISRPLPHPRLTDNKYFFRIETMGKLSLLSRESIIQTAPSNKIAASTKLIPTKHFYVLNQKTQRFTLLVLKKKLLFQLMQLHRKLIKEFMSEQQLSLKNQSDVRRIFLYYNSL